MSSIAKTVVVGMSGGVDSSVAALLLKQQGFHVIGVFMKNWEERDERGVCMSARDYEDVALTCAHIGIPYLSVDFVKEYREQVFQHFLAEYEAGYTPNPDILCNREIKFKAFFNKAMELGADFLATGHYCQTRDGRLLKGVDAEKDQSYFLHAVSGSVLKKVLFPVGGLRKQEVRAIARQHALPTHSKKDSTGICFIGERQFAPFLAQYLASKPGYFKTLNGMIVGQHRGAVFYTLGQRRHLSLGGPGEPWYVVKKDVQNNVVYVERGHDHPALFCDELVACDLTWIDQAVSVFPYACKAKIRYRQQDQDCVIELLPQARVKVRFKEPQWAVSARQSVVFYEGDNCLGGAFIEQAGPSHFSL